MPAHCDAKSDMFASAPLYEEINHNVPADLNTLDIPASFAGKSVLITGATGFIGKVLVEKILRDCPDVKRLYLMIRPGRKGDGIEERVKDMTSSKLFQRLQDSQPDFREKIVPIKADLLQPRLGLSTEDILRLQAEVSIVFHVAATIKFNEVLKLSVQLNVLAVRILLEICRGMDLQAFVHVSTAYSNCPSKHIEEKFYEPPMDPYSLLDSMQWMSDDVIEAITPALIGKWPNTYSFTKALAESIICRDGVGMPICIVRPSIVGASWKDPFPGWIDNLAGATGLFVAGKKGLLRNMLGNRNMVVDLTPVDFVVNSLITSAWHTAITRPTTIPVINSVISPVNPIKWKRVSYLLLNKYAHLPYEQPLRTPADGVNFYTESKAVYDTVNFLGAKIPCYLLDMVAKVQGKRPRMVRIFDSLNRAVETLTFFASNEWQWDCNELTKQTLAMNKQDKKKFNLDLRPLEWSKYFENYVLGAKEHVLKEDMARLPIAKKQAQTMMIAEWTFLCIMLLLLACFAMFLYSFLS